MHGYTDKNVRGTCICTNSNPLPPLPTCTTILTLSKPPGNKHYRTFLHARHQHQIQSYHPVCARTDWCRLEPHSHLDLQLNKSPLPSSTFSPSPLRCRGNNTIATSWITSSTICIRFDGVRALAILLKLMCLYLCCALLIAASVDLCKAWADMARPVFWLLRHPL